MTTKPWAAAGVSRATWYRRQRAAPSPSKGEGGAPRPKAAAEPKGQQQQAPRLDAAAIARIIEASREVAERQRRKVPFNPFKLPAFPPQAIPKRKELQMAMDDLGGLAFGASEWTSMGGGYIEEGLVFPGYTYLAEIAQRAEYRTFSETTATEMTRKWIKFTSVGEEKEKRRKKADDEDREPDPADAPSKEDDDDQSEQIKELKDFMEHLQVRARFAELAMKDGFFGRVHLLFDLGDEKDDQLKFPIGNGRDEKTDSMIKQGSLKRLAVIEPIWTYPTTYNARDPASPNWYNPQVWYVMGKEYDRSRLLPFVGRPVPDLLKPAYAFGGLSMSQMVKPYVDIWLNTRQAVADLVRSFSTMVLETDLSTLMAPQSAANLIARLEMFNALRDNQGAFIINKTSEGFTNVTTPLSGLHELQAQAQEHMMSVARIPAVKFTGMQPDGMNASSEGEIRAWYDTINAEQNKFYRPGLTTTVDFAQITLWGKRNEKIVWDFEPLWEQTAKERGERQKAEAERDQIYVDMGAIAPEEVRGRVIDDPDLPYGELDPDDVPELAEEEEQGLQPEGGRPNPAAEGEPDKGGGANDAVVPFGGALDDWNEGDHPRGQPGNAGQFGSGGGGSSKGPHKDPKQTAHAPQFGLQHGHFTAPAALSGFSPQAGHGNIGRPIDPTKLNKVGGQKGSNPGGVYEDDAGKQFYVKKGKTKDHVRNEMIAAALYDLAGTPTLRYRPVEGGEHVATEMAKLDKDNASKLSKAERAEAQRDFAVHAWLANYDAVGLGGDNLGTVKGVPTALDLGGALEYRAQGKPKGDKFGDKVTELDTLRDASINKDAAGMFGDMTPAAMRESARFVANVKDSAIKAAVSKAGGTEALADKLIARKNDVARQARMFGAEGNPKEPGSTVVIPAGEPMPVKALNGVAFKPWRPPADWNAVEGQAEVDEPRFEVAQGKKPSTGVIVREPDGRVWLVQPRGGYGGYEGTFPKGGLEEGLSLQANAIKECFEESGLKVRITGFAGDHEGDVTTTRYYHAVREGGDPSRHDDETEGVVLAPKDKAGGFLNRKRDRDVLAHDEANFQESKHPRAPDGKFSSTGGRSSKGADPEHQPPDDDPEHGEGQTKPGKPKKTAFGGLWKTGGENDHQNVLLNAKHVLSKPTNAGSSYRQMLAHIIKKLEPASGQEEIVGALKKKLGEAFKLAGDKAAKLAGENAANPEGMKFAGMAKKAYAEAAKLGTNVIPPKADLTEQQLSKPQPIRPPESVTKKAAEQALKDHPGMKAVIEAQKYQPTPADLEKAKKNVKLQLQYVPGAPQESAAAQKLVDAFNAKYEGKTITDPAALGQKVKDFKMLAAAMVPLQSAEQQAQAKKQAEQAAKQAEANKKAAAALKEQQAAAKAKNAEYMKALGISETEASGFDALVSMMSGESSKAELVEKFKTYAQQAQQLGYPISGFQYALIRNYIDGGYHSINKGLRSHSPTVAQHVYARLVNNAIDKLPKFTGTVVRGTTLDASEIAVYKPGHVVTEHAFTSTGIGYKFGGNVHYTIKANGMRGGDFSTGANTGEKEVLFKAKTMFLVHKVEKKGETTYIEMEEVESHG